MAFVAKRYHAKPLGMGKQTALRDPLDVKYMESFFMDLCFFVADFSL